MTPIVHFVWQLQWPWHQACTGACIVPDRFLEDNGFQLELNGFTGSSYHLLLRWPGSACSEVHCRFPWWLNVEWVIWGEVNWPQSVDKVISGDKSEDRVESSLKFCHFLLWSWFLKNFDSVGEIKISDSDEEIPNLKLSISQKDGLFPWYLQFNLIIKEK